MSDQQPINFTPEGPPRTVLAPEPAEVVDALQRALAVDDAAARRDAVAAVAARWPRSLDAWARLGELGRDDTEAYAYFRVGYHRGLDSLRANGWRGSGLRALGGRDQPWVPAGAARPARHRRVGSARSTRRNAAPCSCRSSTRRASLTQAEVSAVAPTVEFAGVVLTGGASRRMGRDKALLPVDGVPMAVRVATAMIAAGAHPVVALGGDADGLRELRPRRGRRPVARRGSARRDRDRLRVGAQRHRGRRRLRPPVARRRRVDGAGRRARGERRRGGVGPHRSARAAVCRVARALLPRPTGRCVRRR